MKRILIFLLLSMNLFAFNFYDVSSVVNEIQQTISEVSYAANSVNYVKSSLGIDNNQQKDMDYYRNPNNFQNINNNQVQTQLFTSTNPQTLNNVVNNFIRGRDIIDIKFSSTSNISQHTRQHNGSYKSDQLITTYSALIIYRR